MRGANGGAASRLTGGEKLKMNFQQALLANVGSLELSAESATGRVDECVTGCHDNKILIF